MGISRYDLAATTKRLMGANGAQVELDGIVFLNLTVGNAPDSEMMYVKPQMTCLFLSRKA